MERQRSTRKGTSVGFTTSSRNQSASAGFDQLYAAALMWKAHLLAGWLMCVGELKHADLPFQQTSCSGETPVIIRGRGPALGPAAEAAAAGTEWEVSRAFSGSTRALRAVPGEAAGALPAGGGGTCVAVRPPADDGGGVALDLLLDDHVVVDGGEDAVLQHLHLRELSLPLERQRVLPDKLLRLAGHARHALVRPCRDDK